MTHNIIILAQGNQSRLGLSHGIKQLLPLPGCGGVSIIGRTLRMIVGLCPESAVTVVGWPAVHAGCRAAAPMMALEAVQLADPGNSSLKGIARALERRGVEHGYGRTVVLLGDVVYSWSCLELLLVPDLTTGGPRFVGTHNLSESGGELWGVAWWAAQEDQMVIRLRNALLRHPPVTDTYQPGQLRRWISTGSVSAALDAASESGEYAVPPYPDYTMDVDIPADLRRLQLVSALAAEDDERHGISW